jgi:hypothetical protein
VAYPASLDELTDGVPSDVAASTTAMDDATYPHDDHHRALATAVEAVEAELGTDPAGASATVKARLDTLDSTVAAKVPASLVDAAGDLLVGSAADTLARLPMGTASQVLRVNSGATGLEYATPSAGGGKPTASFASGFWTSIPGYADAVACAQDVPLAAPIVTDQAMTITRLGIEITSAGGAGSVVRLGIYADSSGLPGSLVLDAGTINGTSATYQEITISQALSASTRYWLMVVPQVGGNVTVRAARGGVSVPMAATSTINEAGALRFTGGYPTRWAGALLSTCSAPDDFRSASPRFLVKVS